jgi:hypothetical protein
MSVFIVSRRTGRSRPVATRRYTTKGAGPAWMPGPAGRLGLTGPAVVMQASEVPGAG